MRELAKPLKRAAQYVRVSTEHQRYAIQNQINALKEYAEQHSIEIVRTYADQGKSGLSLAKRDALKQLLQDVMSNAADFSIILVYDVSRWGRFQDTDESAHYEFLCRQSGIHVEYCGEQFDNDGSPTATLVKNMKRLMAAEYSRDLSTRVFRGQQRASREGFHTNGTTNFGFRRLVVGPDGTPKTLMEAGEEKALATDRTIFVLGPSEEIELVRWIFEEFASGRSLGSIDRSLRKSKLPAAKRRRWGVHLLGEMLRNEIYIGNKIWNKKSQKLGGVRVRNDPSAWVRVDGVCEAIVSKELFERVQNAFPKQRSFSTDDQMIDGLRVLLSEFQYLDWKLINEDPRIPSVTTYGKRFGGLLRAYKLVGYRSPRAYWNPDTQHTLHELRLMITKTTAEKIRRNGQHVDITKRHSSIVIDGSITIKFMVTQQHTVKSGKKYWQLSPSRKSRIDIVAVALMDDENKNIVCYFILPRDEIKPKTIRLFEENRPSIEIYRAKSLDPICLLATYGKIHDNPLNELVMEAIQVTEASLTSGASVATNDNENASKANSLR
jgi:DNA invertase Pin-like site-specific DNA recombinase